MNLPSVRKLMDENEIDALIAFSPENVVYTSGYPLVELLRVLNDRLAMMIVPIRGDTVFIVPNLEESFAKRSSKAGRVRSYVLFETSPIAELGKALEELDLTRSRLGVEKSVAVKYYEELAALMPSAEFVDCDRVFEKLRAVKDDEEVRILKKAAIATEMAIRQSLDQIYEGMSEEQFASSLRAQMVEQGAEDISFLCVGSGQTTMITHYKGGAKPIKRGEMVSVDVGGLFKGYFSDISRMAVIGGPSDEQEKMYNDMVEIYRTVLEAVKPGARANELYARCLKLAKEKDVHFGLPLAGHGIGIGLHEEPMLHPYSQWSLREGNVLNVEVAFPLPKVATFHVEDTIKVTRDGYETLSNYTPVDELHVI